MRGAFWRTALGHTLAVVAAVLIAALAFLYRFNALGGALGGFDNDEFATLTRVDLVLAGQQPLRDFADGELRAVWPSLTYELPALAMRLWGRTLLVHAWLTLGALAACAAAVFLLARDLSRRWVVALLAAVVVIVSLPNAYNYPKVVVLTGAVALVRWAVRRPTPVPLGALGAWAVIAALFRHDYAVYVVAAGVAAIVALEPRPWRVPARRLAICAGVAFVLALPSAVWVQRYAGIAQYVNLSLVASGTEGGTRRLTDWPVVSAAEPFARDSLIAFNYWAFWAIPLVGALVLAVRPWQPSAPGEYGHYVATVSAGPRDPRDPMAAVTAALAESRRYVRGASPWAVERATGWALVAMTPVVNYFFLRSNLPARFGDAVVPVVLLGAWITGVAPGLSSQALRALASIVPPLLLALMLTAFVHANDVPQDLRIGGFADSAAIVAARLREVAAELRSLPSDRWTAKDTQGPMAVARYLAECTGPADHVLMGTYADEIPYFSRRPFAGGQGYFAFGFLRTEADQRLALERLARQSVPVAITDYDWANEFAADYPLIARHVEARYREVGEVRATDGAPYLRVFVDTGRQPLRSDPVLGFPCFR